MSHRPARIVLATIGSLGDLHPVVALALELRQRGHHVVVATTENYREKLGALGLEFHPLRPDLLSGGDHVIAEIMDGARGTRRLLKDRMFPAVRDTYDDLAAAAVGADLLVTSEIVFAGSILAATHRVRWIATFLGPTWLLSTHDPPVLPLPWGLHWRPRLGPGVQRFGQWIAKIASHSWWRPVRELRRDLGLPPGEHPVFGGKYSPLLNLALFSPVLQAPQPDWPATMEQAGFCFFDENVGDAGQRPALPVAVENFLQAGSAPIVFTLGSAAVYIAENFYQESARAAESLGRRAILLLGKNSPPPNLPPSILAWDYLPFAQIFLHAAAIVHQGGVGTTAQALRSGRPMLVVPFAHDQFDNAARVTRLGVARTMSRASYRSERVARELGPLLTEPRYAEQAGRVAATVRAERGVERACDAIERKLG